PRSAWLERRNESITLAYVEVLAQSIRRDGQGIPGTAAGNNKARENRVATLKGAGRMGTDLASSRHRVGFVVACFLCPLSAAPLLTAGVARAQEGHAAWPAGGDGSFASTAQKPVDPPPSAPRWTFSAETLVLGRTGGANQS